MLGAIRCVTICADDLATIEHAYTEVLEYRVTERSQLSMAQAKAWSAPAMAGAEMLLMSPSAAEDFQFRFIARPADPDYIPLTTWGWNAAELMVRDVDAMAKRIPGSAFELVGEPRDLSFCSDIRAMQIKGPGNEILYLTEFKRPVPGLDVPVARSAVDRTFIVIVGGPSMERLQDFYHQQFHIPRAPVVESRVTMLSRALGVSVETLYPIAALGLQGQSLIEVDEMPGLTSQRRTESGLLPPGIALVSFNCDELPPQHETLQLDQLPYSGKKAAVIYGVAGEIIELISS